MNALKIALLASVVFVGNGLYADDGREAAAKICQGLFHQSDKTSCLAIVEAAQSFEEKAVGICAGLFHTSDKLECLKACQDKTYLSATLETCAGSFHTSDKLNCLRSNGKKAPASSSVLSDSERDLVILTVRRAIREIRDHEKARAIERLYGLIDDLDRAKSGRR